MINPDINRKILPADAEEEAHFNMLASTYPEVARAVEVIKELSADQQFKYEAMLIEKSKRDWISSIVSSKEEGFDEGIQIGEERQRAMAIKEKDDMVVNSLRLKVPVDTIMAVFGYSVDRIKELEKHV